MNLYVPKDGYLGEAEKPAPIEKPPIDCKQLLTEYSHMVAALESPYETIVQGTANKQNARLLHSALGLVTEAGEFADQMKKAICYGKPVDLVNIKEELGDLFWYMTLAMNAANIQFEEILEANVRKLRKRYPGGFSLMSCENRDIQAEREALTALSGDR